MMSRIASGIIGTELMFGLKLDSESATANATPGTAPTTPVSPAPRIPPGFVVDGDSTWLSSTVGTSRKVGIA